MSRIGGDQEEKLTVPVQLPNATAETVKKVSGQKPSLQLLEWCEHHKADQNLVDFDLLDDTSTIEVSAWDQQLLDGCTKLQIFELFSVRFSLSLISVWFRLRSSSRSTGSQTCAAKASP